MDPDLSVVICTRNRCKLLRSCLESVISQKCDPWAFEVVVVDNASNDTTKDVVLEFSRQTGRVRYVYEGQKGLSRARATGARASNGRYIAYLDDDATAHPGWCAAVCQAFEELSAAQADKVVALGGPIEPVFEAGRPAWLTAQLEPLYTILDLGTTSRFFPPRLVPVGANMAFRREILQDYPWDERLIRICDEVELFNRLAADGFSYLYVPAMRVSHFVPAERCTVEWILRRYHAEGLYQKYVRHGFFPKARLMAKASLLLLRSIVYLLFSAERDRLFRRCTLKLQIGILEGFLDIGGGPTDYEEGFIPPKSR